MRVPNIQKEKKKQIWFQNIFAEKKKKKKMYIYIYICTIC